MKKKGILQLKPTSSVTEGMTDRKRTRKTAENRSKLNWGQKSHVADRKIKIKK